MISAPVRGVAGTPMRGLVRADPGSDEEEREALPPIETLFKSAGAGGRWADDLE